MVKKKYLIVVSVIIFLFFLVGIILVAINFKLEKSLTKKQKLEDFDYLYDVLIEHQPMLEEYKNIINFDFEGNRDYYRNLIRDTKSDYEFFVMMNMIMGDFPGVHTGLYMEPYDAIENAGYDTSVEFRRVFGQKQTAEPWIEYWQDCWNRSMEEERGGTGFIYYDGHYISTQCYIAENTEQTLELLAIDGEPIDEYIKRKEVNGELAYDAQNNKVFRYVINLNLSHGQMVQATFQNSEGDIFEGEVYIRNKDYAFIEGDLEPIKTPEAQELVIKDREVSVIQLDEVGGYYDVVLDKQHNTSYIYLFDFKSVDGNELSEAIQKACEYDNIILDLRTNTGGYRQYFLDYVYPWLFKDDVESHLCFYMNKSTTLQKKHIRIKEKVEYDEFYDGMKEIVKLEQNLYGYGKAKEEKNVYVLISYNGYSAADWAAAMLKEQTLAVLIGTPTGGEGLGNTSCIDVMPNSHMLFQFQNSQAFNSDGTDNSVYGTAPDIYIAHTFESIAKRAQLLREGENIMSYESRLKWDNILIETLEIIENNRE